MQKRDETKLVRIAFDSVAEVQRYIEREAVRWGSDFRNSRTTEARRSWDLGAGYDEAMRLARDGWLEGAERAQEALKAFTPKSPASENRVDFYGHMPHVPRYCAGAPDSMIRHHRQPTIGGGRVLTLYVPVAANAGTSAQSMSNLGVAIAQYVNQLETDGIRVELHGCFTASMKRGERLTHSWLIKHADQPLDLAVIAFAIGHPAMLRRLGFALHERSPARLETYGYGSARETEMTDLIDPPSTTYILNGMDQAAYYADTPEKALDFVAAKIEQAISDREKE